MPEVADVFRSSGPAYQERFGADLLPSHRRAMEDILHCRTEALGGHLLPCDHCGQEHYADHSCRHRSCPKCHHYDTEGWLAARRQELRPVPDFHGVLPLPQELHELVRRHQQDLYDMVLRAAAQARSNLAMDPHDVGGLIGVLCILHTWTRTLTYHPHVHCLVPAGGVSADRTEWRLARTSYLVPVHALAKLFRGLLLALVRQERPDLIICFRYQDAQDQHWKTMTLPAHEFIRRFLQHVLPQGFHKVRYYWLWSPSHRPLLHQRQLCLAGHAAAPPPTTPEPTPRATEAWGTPLRAGQPCPSCGQGLLVVIRSMPRLQRGPP
jgi:Transposase zinc-binding domain/Putative transposase